MSLRGGGGGYVCHWSEFQNQSFCVLRRKPCLSVYTIVSICTFFCRCHSFNPSLCHLWPFLLFNVTVLRPCPLWEFSLDRASNLAFIDHSLDLMARRALTGLRNIIPTIMIGNMEMELPAMYMMNRFIGICLNGPSAISHDF